MWNDGLGMKIRGKRKDIRNFLEKEKLLREKRDQGIRQVS